MSYHRIGKGGTKYWGTSAAGIIFTDGKQMLLLKRSEKGDNPGTWGIPGGKHRDGETPIATAIRETKEETGLDSIPGHRFDSLESKDGHHRFMTFLYRISKPFSVDVSDEHTAYEWIDLSKVSGADLHPKFEENWPRYLKAIQRKMNFTEWLALRGTLC